MTQTMAERKKRQRERLRASGAIPMSFVLDSKLVGAFNKLRSIHGSVNATINGAIHSAASELSNYEYLAKCIKDPG